MALAAIALALIAGAIWLLRMTEMPLKSYGGPLPPLTSQQSEQHDHLSSISNIYPFRLGNGVWNKPGRWKRQQLLSARISNESDMQ